MKEKDFAILTPGTGMGATKTINEAVAFAKKLIKNYDEQENWSTAKPLYYKVQYQTKVMTHDSGEATSYCMRNLFGEFEYRDISQLTSDHEVVGFYKEKWVDDPQSGLFFTRKGAEDYLAINKHNIPGPTRFYIGHFFRNDEMKKVIGALRYLAKLDE